MKPLDPRSIFWSCVLLAAPLVLFVVGQEQSGVRETYFEVGFFLSLAAIFLAANRFADRLALMALLRWLCESYAVVGRGHRTTILGLIFLFSGIGVAISKFT